MPKRPAHHRVKVHEVYTIFEAASTLGVHRQTVTRWVKKNGLKAATGSKPWLIEGADLKSFLIARRQAGKRPLLDGELFCLPCGHPRRPAGDFVEYHEHRLNQGVLCGVCPTCDRLMHRFVTPAKTRDAAGDLEVIFAGASERLRGMATRPVNVHLKQEAEAHV